MNAPDLSRPAAAGLHRTLDQRACVPGQSGRRADRVQSRHRRVTGQVALGQQRRSRLRGGRCAGRPAWADTPPIRRAR